MDQDSLHGLLTRGLAGDQNAYHFFLKELSGNLRAFFRKRLTTRPAEVEDMVQETLIAIHKQRHTYQHDQALAAWIYAIAHYKLVDLLRRQSRHDWLNTPLDEEQEILFASDPEASEARRDIIKLLEQLPEGQRQIITQVKLEGWSIKEAAGASGMSETAVKVSIHRGLRKLAGKLKGTK